MLKILFLSHRDIILLFIFIYIISSIFVPSTSITTPKDTRIASSDGVDPSILVCVGTSTFVTITEEIMVSSNDEVIISIIELIIASMGAIIEVENPIRIDV